MPSRSSLMEQRSKECAHWGREPVPRRSGGTHGRDFPRDDRKQSKASEVTEDRKQAPEAAMRRPVSSCETSR